jgi:hypothetical protein
MVATASPKNEVREGPEHVRQSIKRWLAEARVPAWMQTAWNRWESDRKYLHTTLFYEDAPNTLGVNLAGRMIQTKLAKIIPTETDLSVQSERSPGSVDVVRKDAIRNASTRQVMAGYTDARELIQAADKAEADFLLEVEAKERIAESSECLGAKLGKEMGLTELSIPAALGMFTVGLSIFKIQWGQDWKRTATGSMRRTSEDQLALLALRSAEYAAGIFSDQDDQYTELMQLTDYARKRAQRVSMGISSDPRLRMDQWDGLAAMPKGEVPQRELLPEPDVWEGPILDLLRPENLRWDWSVPFSQIDRAAWVQEQVPMHIDLATAQFGLTPAERDQIMAKASDNERDTTGRSIRDQAEAADPDASTYEDRIQRGKIIVWDRYDRLTHRHVIFIEGLDRLLVDEVPDVMPAWGHPYVGVSANDFDGAMVPRSDVSFIRKINDAINQKLTDGQESLWASMKRYLYKKGSMDPGELEKLMGARPHDAIEVKDPAGIKEAMREIASDDWNPAKYDLEQLFRLLELVMGMSLSELGVVNTARFATEAQIANDNSQANDGRHALAMATAWKRIFEAALSMANVLLPEKTVRWLIGQAAFWPPAPTRDDLLRTLSITVNAAGSKRAARAQAASSINDAMDALTKAFDLKERGDRIGAEVNMAPLISAILRTVDVPQGARQLVKFRSALAQPQPTIPGLPAPAGNPAIAGALPAPANPGIPSTMP